MQRFAHDSIVPFKESQLGKKKQIAEMFDKIAARYDFLNHFLSAGIDVSWRRKALKQLIPLQPDSLLDVAIMAARILKPRRIIGIDISEGMLSLGRQKLLKSGLDRLIELQTGDSEAINFPDGSFDAVTVAFGVRNFEHLQLGLSEIKRVLRNGGKLVVLEFSKPKTKAIQHLYNLYMGIVAPEMGRIFSQNCDAYKYLNDSVKHFPEGNDFIRILDSTGFKETSCKRLSFGICSIYCGIK
jgi:demethylmenaquinone methyltransferase/2-methoxy-6-polyprenyl-1,4-benzoquinol methylase